MWFSPRRTTYVVVGESGEVGNPGTLGMTKGRATLPASIGCRDPRSQERDLGHPSIFTDAATLGIVLLRAT
jgi:hypothetical protein